jgi:DNA polymerase-1
MVELAHEQGRGAELGRSRVSEDDAPEVLAAIYLTPTENHWACDIEADDLREDVTTIWCVCVENCVTGERHEFRDAETFRAWLGEVATDDGPPVLVGHNFLAYDMPVLNLLWDAGIDPRTVVDTYVLSQLYNPNLRGGHALGDWGRRLRMPKGDHSDFKTFSAAMLEYCRQDTAITARLFRRLTARMRAVGFTETGAWIEHLSWDIIQNRQRVHGFPFNKEAAERLYVELRDLEGKLRDEIYQLWPPKLTVVGEYKGARLKSGEQSKQFIRHREQYPLVEEGQDGTYRVSDYVAFNLGSPKQRIDKLLELGWEPTKFTKKTEKGGGGNPQVDEEELLAFAEATGNHEVKALARWLVVNSRANTVRTWLEAYNEKTGAIHGRLFLNATLRYRHSQPNSANIPAVKTKKVGEEDVILYGEEGTWAYECRDLFTCGDARRYRLVGIDAKGIQLRNLAHYAYTPEFADTVLTGDPHKKNIAVLGLVNKPAAKKFLYTTLMGGGGAKLAADQAQFGSKLTAKQGSNLKSRLITSIPGFKELIADLQTRLNKTGRITLCDGTPILVPSDHMVIPYLLQGDESRLMKLASIYLHEIIDANGWADRVFKVADIHDEWQFVVAVELVDEFIAAALPCFIRAGEFFNYKVPIEGDSKVGLTWAETH